MSEGNNETSERCKYCDEILNEEDSCDGSRFDGIKLCVYCLSEWQSDNNCDCEDCEESARASMIDCLIDDYKEE